MKFTHTLLAAAVAACASMAAQAAITAAPKSVQICLRLIAESECSVPTETTGRDPGPGAVVRDSGSVARTPVARGFTPASELETGKLETSCPMPA